MGLEGGGQPPQLLGLSIAANKAIHADNNKSTFFFFLTLFDGFYLLTFVSKLFFAPAELTKCLCIFKKKNHKHPNLGSFIRRLQH